MWNIVQGMNMSLTMTLIQVTKVQMRLKILCYLMKLMSLKVLIKYAKNKEASFIYKMAAHAQAKSAKQMKARMIYKIKAQVSTKSVKKMKAGIIKNMQAPAKKKMVTLMLMESYLLV